MNIFKKTNKETTKLPMTGKVKKGFRIYCTAIMGAALVLGTSVTAFAAGDPITVINNLSTFIFGLILSRRRCHHHLCQGDSRPDCRLSSFTPWGVPGFSGTPPIL